jgi:hypothetical protein
MVKYISFFLVVICLGIVSSCGSNQSLFTQKPEAEEAGALVYDNVPSFINFPVNIKLKDIENQTNAILKGVIYEDKTIEDDNVEIIIWKQAPITIQNDNTSGGKIETRLPLKAIIKYRVGTEAMGINLYKTNEFYLNGVVTLNSVVSLSNWKLKSKTTLKDLEWKESPSMVVYGKNLPVTYLVNPAINIFKADIEKSIDAAIEASMDFKPNVLAAIEKITAPFKMSDYYESWLRIVPVEIYSTDAKLKNDQVLLNMGMKCNMETVIGEKPESKFDANNIVLKPVAKMPNHVTTNIIAISTYNDASKIMTKNFSGQEFGEGSKKVTVKKVDIWHKNGKMVIALDLNGSVNGTIYLQGIPLYDSGNKEIFFADLDYVLDTKSQLTRTANWLAKGAILKRIKESCRYSIQPNLDEGKQTLLNYLNN